MIALNLTATTKEQIILKDYLENNASETLAEKLNNGVRIEKDGKTLVNKKDLTTFMNYACDEAKKQAEKGARFARIEDATVFNWAIHYFEEDSIEGTLYNEDGTEYKPSKPVTKPYVKPTTAVAAPPAPKEMTLFDLMNADTVEPIEETADDDEPEIEEPDTDTVEQAPYPYLPAAARRQISDTQTVDDDGVIHEIKPVTSDIPSVLTKIFGDTLIAR